MPALQPKHLLSSSCRHQGQHSGNTPVLRDHPVFNWLTDGKDCLKGRTPEEFSTHIDRLASDKPLRQKLVNQGNDTLKKHDIKNSIRSLANLYSELV